MEKQNIKKLAQIALLIAIEILLSRFLSIATPIVKIGFSFLPIAVAGMLYGPFYGGAVAGLGDFLGALLFPIGAYFPGFTLTAFLSGSVYGLLLHRRSESWPRVCAAVIIISLVLHLGLNSVWLHVITGKGVWAILPARVVQTLVMIPLQIAMVRAAGSRRCLAVLTR